MKFDGIVLHSMIYEFKNLFLISSCSPNILIIQILNHLMIGRHQILQWINTVVQSQYATIQSHCDGIAYCQIEQAIHPGSINVMKMNLVTKLPIDCEKNLKILSKALKNMGIPLTQNASKMAQEKFQDNIQFTQWIYNHAKSYGFENLQNYQAYERRLQILKKQKRIGIK